jgi:hypothetical protein
MWFAVCWWWTLHSCIGPIRVQRFCHYCRGSRQNKHNILNFVWLLDQDNPNPNCRPGLVKKSLKIRIHKSKKNRHDEGCHLLTKVKRTAVKLKNCPLIRLFRITSIPTTFRLFRVLMSEMLGRRLPVFTLLLTVTTSAYQS